MASFPVSISALPTRFAAKTLVNAETHPWVDQFHATFQKVFHNVMLVASELLTHVMTLPMVLVSVLVLTLSRTVWIKKCLHHSTKSAQPDTSVAHFLEDAAKKTVTTQLSQLATVTINQTVPLSVTVTVHTRSATTEDVSVPLTVSVLTRCAVHPLVNVQRSPTVPTRPSSGLLSTLPARACSTREFVLLIRSGSMSVCRVTSLPSSLLLLATTLVVTMMSCLQTLLCTTRKGRVLANHFLLFNRL
ncbi:hypothetical protein BCR33DRAFT_8078 [Rhizoclosmatium globosum]|uniref:Uncharacterized protein n=1 Tax=Rhizoclosmatium globosum TaxID=329046 RepID=A0A1Y2D3Q4_9FUNG|nr:hypothetical protein BCR33DRAFT_8078 [Rhizoclosmatium globosum]|eukprot:ORY53774.1 hypothetical protein BCR33DRAFT_8078 [Rhizoclosmatium globosum]